MMQDKLQSNFIQPTQAQNLTGIKYRPMFGGIGEIPVMTGFGAMQGMFGGQRAMFSNPAQT